MATPLGRFTTDEMFVATRKPATHGVFFVNPFWGLIATDRQSEAEYLGTYYSTSPPGEPKAYLYKVRITMERPALVNLTRSQLADWKQQGVKFGDVELAVIAGFSEAEQNRKPGLRRRLLDLGHDGLIIDDETGSLHVHAFDNDQIELISGPTELAGLRPMWPRWR